MNPACSLRAWEEHRGLEVQGATELGEVQALAITLGCVNGQRLVAVLQFGER